MKKILNHLTNDWYKYLFELLVITAGVFGAFMLNNWSEKQIEKKEELLLLSNVLVDLKADSAHFENCITELSLQREVVDLLIMDIIQEDSSYSHPRASFIRWSTIFRPITGLNHSEAASSIANNQIRKNIQAYFLVDEFTRESFDDYESITLDWIRPYMRQAGMHDLNELEGDFRPSIDTNKDDLVMKLHPEVLKNELQETEFQQLLFEKKLKTNEFAGNLQLLMESNNEMIKLLAKKLNK